jgi:hypothetical protein
MRRRPETIQIAVSVFICCLLCSACSRQESGKSQNKASAPTKLSRYSSSDLKIDLTPDVAKTWKSVRIQILDKTNFLTSECDVPIGGAYQLTEPSIKIEAPVFVPDFVMKNGIITSRSNQLNNPAVKIVAYQQGKQIFNGWVYGRYQETDIHPRFRFMLADVTRK